VILTAAAIKLMMQKMMPDIKEKAPDYYKKFEEKTGKVLNKVSDAIANNEQIDLKEEIAKNGPRAANYVKDASRDFINSFVEDVKTRGEKFTGRTESEAKAALVIDRKTLENVNKNREVELKKAQIQQEISADSNGASRKAMAAVLATIMTAVITDATKDADTKSNLATSGKLAERQQKLMVDLIKAAPEEFKQVVGELKDSREFKENFGQAGEPVYGKSSALSIEDERRNKEDELAKIKEAIAKEQAEYAETIRKGKEQLSRMLDLATFSGKIEGIKRSLTSSLNADTIQRTFKAPAAVGNSLVGFGGGIQPALRLQDMSASQRLYAEGNADVKSSLNAYSDLSKTRDHGVQMLDAMAERMGTMQENIEAYKDSGDKGKAKKLQKELDSLSETYNDVAEKVSRTSQTLNAAGEGIRVITHYQEALTKLQNSLDAAVVDRMTKSYEGLGTYIDNISKMLGGSHPDALVSVTPEQQRLARKHGVDLDPNKATKYDVQLVNLREQLFNTTDSKDRAKIQQQIRDIGPMREAERRDMLQKRYDSTTQSMLDPFKEMYSQIQTIRITNPNITAEQDAQLVDMSNILETALKHGLDKVPIDTRIRELEARRATVGVGTQEDRLLEEQLAELYKWKANPDGSPTHIYRGVSVEQQQRLFEGRDKMAELFAGDQGAVMKAAITDPLKGELVKIAAYLEAMAKDAGIDVSSVLKDLTGEEPKSGISALLAKVGSFFGSNKETVPTMDYASAIRRNTGGPSTTFGDTPTSIGGNVSGPGGPREDKVAAYLSPGEFVIRAHSARQIGYANLDHMNKKGTIPAMFAANGGQAPAITTGSKFADGTPLTAQHIKMVHNYYNDADASLPPMFDPENEDAFDKRTSDAMVKHLIGGVPEKYRDQMAGVSNVKDTYNRLIDVMENNDLPESALFPATPDASLARLKAIKENESKGLFGKFFGGPSDAKANPMNEMVGLGRRGKMLKEITEGDGFADGGRFKSSGDYIQAGINRAMKVGAELDPINHKEREYYKNKNREFIEFMKKTVERTEQERYQRAIESDKARVMKSPLPKRTIYEDNTKKQTKEKDPSMFERVFGIPGAHAEDYISGGINRAWGDDIRKAKEEKARIEQLRKAIGTPTKVPNHKRGYQEDVVFEYKSDDYKKISGFADGGTYREFVDWGIGGKSDIVELSKEVKRTSAIGPVTAVPKQPVSTNYDTMMSNARSAAVKLWGLESSKELDSSGEKSVQYYLDQYREADAKKAAAEVAAMVNNTTAVATAPTTTTPIAPVDKPMDLEELGRKFKPLYQTLRTPGPELFATAGKFYGNKVMEGIDYANSLEQPFNEAYYKAVDVVKGAPMAIGKGVMTGLDYTNKIGKQFDDWVDIPGWISGFKHLSNEETPKRFEQIKGLWGDFKTFAGKTWETAKDPEWQKKTLKEQVTDPLKNEVMRFNDWLFDQQSVKGFARGAGKFTRGMGADSAANFFDYFADYKRTSKAPTTLVGGLVDMFGDLTPSGIYGTAEGLTNFLSGGPASIVGGMAGLSKWISTKDVNEASKVQHWWTDASSYSTRTDKGAQAASTLRIPFNMLGSMGQRAGDHVLKKTDSSTMAALSASAVQAIPLALPWAKGAVKQGSKLTRWGYHFQRGAKFRENPALLENPKAAAKNAKHLEKRREIVRKFNEYKARKKMPLVKASVTAVEAARQQAKREKRGYAAGGLVDRMTPELYNQFTDVIGSAAANENTPRLIPGDDRDLWAYYSSTDAMLEQAARAKAGRDERSYQANLRRVDFNYDLKDLSASNKLFEKSRKDIDVLKHPDIMKSFNAVTGSDIYTDKVSGQRMGKISKKATRTADLNYKPTLDPKYAGMGATDLAGLGFQMQPGMVSNKLAKGEHTRARNLSDLGISSFDQLGGVEIPKPGILPGHIRDQLVYAKMIHEAMEYRKLDMADIRERGEAGSLAEGSFEEKLFKTVPLINKLFKVAGESGTNIFKDSRINEKYVKTTYGSLASPWDTLPVSAYGRVDKNGNVTKYEPNTLTDIKDLKRAEKAYAESGYTQGPTDGTQILGRRFVGANDSGIISTKSQKEQTFSFVNAIRELAGGEVTAILHEKDVATGKIKPVTAAQRDLVAAPSGAFNDKKGPSGAMMRTYGTAAIDMGSGPYSKVASIVRSITTPDTNDKNEWSKRVASILPELRKVKGVTSEDVGKAFRDYGIPVGAPQLASGGPAPAQRNSIPKFLGGIGFAHGGVVEVHRGESILNPKQTMDNVSANQALNAPSVKIDSAGLLQKLSAIELKVEDKTVKLQVEDKVLKVEDKTFEAVLAENSIKVDVSEASTQLGNSVASVISQLSNDISTNLREVNVTIDASGAATQLADSIKAAAAAAKFTLPEGTMSGGSAGAAALDKTMDMVTEVHDKLITVKQSFEGEVKVLGTKMENLGQEIQEQVNSSLAQRFVSVQDEINAVHSKMDVLEDNVTSKISSVAENGQEAIRRANQALNFIS
jgi:archaellum component FlaC